MRNPKHGNVIQDRSYAGPESHPDRIYHQIILDAGCAGRAYCTVSLPQELPAGGCRVILLASGIEVGDDILSHLPDHGDYAVIAYEYPCWMREAENVNKFFNSSHIRNAVNNVPGQLLTIVDWARIQPWANGHPVSLAGVSLGGIFLPVTYRLAEAQCIDLGPGIIAHSGACLHAIVCRNLDPCTRFRRLSAWFGAKMIQQIEPCCHAPHTNNEFLIIESSQDEVIPRVSREALKRCVPQPKTVVTLDTPHITEDRPDIIQEIYDIARDWLEARPQGSGLRS
jgi:hypothetical protein